MRLSFGVRTDFDRVALVNNHIRIVQASILGSVLVNLLLILGSALFASSMSNIDPHSSMEESELLAALLFVSVFVILIPVSSFILSLIQTTDLNRPHLTTLSI
jgi:calcium/proton exchanger cax